MAQQLVDDPFHHQEQMLSERTDDLGSHVDLQTWFCWLPTTRIGEEGGSRSNLLPSSSKPPSWTRRKGCVVGYYQRTVLKFVWIRKASLGLLALVGCRGGFPLFT